MSYLLSLSLLPSCIVFSLLVQCTQRVPCTKTREDDRFERGSFILDMRATQLSLLPRCLHASVYVVEAWVDM